MGFFRGPNIVTDSLLSAYDFGSPWSYPSQSSPGGTDPVFKDVVGGNDMTVKGSPTFNIVGYMGMGYMTFSTNGGLTTEYCICNPFPFPTTEVTIEIWHRMVSQGETQGIMSYAVSGDDNESLMFWNGNSGNGPWSFYGPTGAVSTGINTTNGAWVQLVRTDVRSSGAVKGYVNGTQEYSGTLAAGTNFTSGGALVIGQESDSVGGGFSSTQCFRGNIGIIRIYSKALSGDEVSQNFEAQRQRYGI